MQSELLACRERGFLYVPGIFPCPMLFEKGFLLQMRSAWALVGTEGTGVNWDLGPGRVLFGFLLLPLFLPGMKAAAPQPQRQLFLGEEPGWFDTMFPRMTRIKRKKNPAATTLALASLIQQLRVYLY